MSGAATAAALPASAAAPKPSRADRLAAAAKALGGSWTPFDQADYLKGQELGKDGVCGALSIAFLGHATGGAGAIAGFLAHIATEAGRKEIMALWTQQKTHVSGWAATYLLTYKLAEKYNKWRDNMGMIALFLKYKGYYEITFTNRDSAEAAPAGGMHAHAVAFISAGPAGGGWIFDPNWGIGSFPSVEKAAKMLDQIQKNLYKPYAGRWTMLTQYN